MSPPAEPAGPLQAGLLLGAGLVVVAAVLLGRGAQPAGSFGSLTLHDARLYIAAAGLAGLGFVAAASLLRRAAAWPRWMLPAILALGLAARLAVLLAPPVLSTDLYRYVWDGRVQAAGINPYRYLPADPTLRALRDATPPGGAGAEAIYPNINRVDSAPTIYPPAAQLLFRAIQATAPTIWGVKAAMLGFDLLTALALFLLLRAARLPAPMLLLWLWNPLVIWEFAGAGHIDAAGIAASAFAMLAAVRGRRVLAGVLLGGGVLFKLLPAAIFPTLWRRWDLRLPLAAAATIAAGYALYSSAGWRVLGYLPGYAAEEGIDDGGGFLLLRLLALAVPLPAVAGKVYLALGLLLLAALAALVAFRFPWPADPASRAIVIARGALVLSGALMAVLSPHYPWYLAMLALPATLVPAWSALWLMVAAPLLYLDHGHDEVVYPALVFLPALPLLLIDLAPSRKGAA